MLNLDAKRVKFLPYFLSQYVWVAIILIFLLVGVAVAPHQTVPPVKSSNRNFPQNHLNLFQRPLVLMHLTDTHLNHAHSARSERMIAALNFAEKINVSSIIISGDLVDNKIDELSYGVQNDKDYPHYSSVIDSFKNLKDLIYDISGNHDEYGLSDFTSKSHQIMKFSKYFSRTQIYNLTSFWASKTIISDSINDDNNIKVELISINPYRYPTPHAKLGFWNHPNSEILDQIEKVLIESDSDKSAPIKFAQVHFPIRLMITNSKTTQTKLTLGQLFEKHNISLVMSGHLHPSQPSILHTNNVLEVVGSDLKEHEGFGIVTIDNTNGNVVYHSGHLDEGGQPKALLLNPVPMTQISKETIFNDKNIQIRVLYFIKENHNNNKNNNNDNVLPKDLVINAHIDSTGNVVTLEYKGIIREGQALFTNNVTISSYGKHSIRFSGDWSYSTDFFIGDEVHFDTKEKIYGFPNLITVCFAGLIIFFIFDFYITFPFNFSLFNSSSENGIFYEAHEWIIGRQMSSDAFSTTKKYLVSMFLGPFFVRKRIQMINSTLFRVMLFILAIWPIFLPTIFMTIEGSMAMVWSYGYVCKGKNFVDVFGYIFSFIFEGVLVTPTLVMASMTAISVPWKHFFWLDAIVFHVCMFVLFFIDYYMVYEASFLGGVFTSPGFFLWPFLLIAMFAVIRYKGMKAEKGERSSTSGMNLWNNGKANIYNLG